MSATLAPDAHPAVVAIIPARNEAPGIATLVGALRAGGVPVLVVDGGSADDTAALAMAAGARVLRTEPGRARQMRAGAEMALAEGACALLFLHADLSLPNGWRDAIDTARSSPGVAPWARFDVRLHDPAATPAQRAGLAMIGAAMNLRSAITGISTGDQGLLVRADCYCRSGGFAPIALMEDVEFSARLRRLHGHPYRMRAPLQVSARRWVRDGVFATVLHMWWMRLRWFAGASPDALARAYYR